MNKVSLLFCDQAQSALRSTYSRALRYSPFGVRPAAGGISSGFNGQWFERLPQGYLPGAGYRLYAPSLARLSAADRLSPFGAGGINSYAWCNADPVNFNDPTGRSPARIWAGLRKWFKPSPGYSSPFETQRWALGTAKRYAVQDQGSAVHVYEGWVFRGDQRPPSTIFEQGFALRRAVTDRRTITGELGGFGGGKDALDPDGGGISTSAFYKKDGAGAFFYGAGRQAGGYTYLIDARRIRGYDLYRNWEHAKGRALPTQPWEINYGVAIPASKVRGVYDRNHHFRPNPGYR